MELFQCFFYDGRPGAVCETRPTWWWRGEKAGRGILVQVAAMYRTLRESVLGGPL